MTRARTEMLSAYQTVRAREDGDEALRLAAELAATVDGYRVAGRAARRARSAARAIAEIALLRAESAMWQARARLAEHRLNAAERVLSRLAGESTGALRARAGRGAATAERNRVRAEAHQRRVAENVRKLTRLEDLSDRNVAKRLHVRRSTVGRWRK